MNLEEKLGYFFFDKRILQRALTRPSYAIEQAEIGQTGEDQSAYEVMGYALLTTVLTELLIRYGYENGEALITYQQQLMRESVLANLSQSMGIGYVLKFGESEKGSQVYDRPEVLAAGLAAVIGGIYFDGGYSQTRQVVQRLFASAFAEPDR